MYEFVSSDACDEARNVVPLPLVDNPKTNAGIRGAEFVQSRAGNSLALLAFLSRKLASFSVLLFDRVELPSFLSSPEMPFFHPSGAQCGLASTNQIHTSVSWWPLLFPIVLCSLPSSPNTVTLAFLSSSQTPTLSS